MNNLEHWNNVTKIKATDYYHVHHIFQKGTYKHTYNQTMNKKSHKIQKHTMHLLDTAGWALYGGNFNKARMELSSPMGSSCMVRSQPSISAYSRKIVMVEKNRW